MQDLHAPDDVLTEHHEHEESDIDLGSGHRLHYFGWAPDRDLNPQYAAIPDMPRCGASVYHQKPDGSPCEGAIMFDIPGIEKIFPDDARWQVNSWDPLTLSPSLFCNPAKGGCGDHGFVKQGRWQRA